MEETKLLLTVASVMVRTSLGRTKIYQLIGSGEIPTVRIGRALRIPAKALQEWVEKQQKTSKRA
jgi:excisionase family DNA binding protein